MATKEKSKATGRPRVEFTREQIDTAKEVLGSAVYASKAVGRLVRRFKIGRDSAYKLVDLARDEVIQGLREEGSVGDPATAIALFLTSIMANERKPAETRIAAANSLTRLLALGRASGFASSASDVERFLADLLARQAARKAIEAAADAADDRTLGESESGQGGPLGRPEAVESVDEVNGG